MKIGKIGILSDDLTGAGDAGLAFASRGMSVLIEAFCVPGVGPGDCDVFVVNTEARTSERPKEAIQKGIARLREADCDFFYLKLDSCLRGNIGAMLDGFIEGLRLDKIFYVPAFPQMGRTTKNGVQLLYGKPVHRTEMARDPKNPVRESHIPTILQRSCRNAEGISILDIESSGEMLRLARKILSSGTNAVAASAGLAHTLARLLKPSSAIFPREGEKAIFKTLVVAGSKNPVSLRQLNRLSRSVKNGWRILNASRLGGKNLARSLQRYLSEGPNRLVLVGGETAQRSCQALGVYFMRILGEAAPGCALCEVVGKPYEIVLKPGGFGDENTLMRCLE